MRQIDRTLAAVLAACLLLCGSGSATAAGRSPDAALDIIPDTGDRFEMVDELLKAKKWDRALAKLAQIADEAEDSVWSEDGKIYLPVAAHIRNRMIAMPPDGLAFYRLRYDPEAQAMFREGVSKQSVPTLDAVDDRYPASSFAAPALDAAASILIDRGLYDAGAGRLLRLLARPVPASPSRAEGRLRAVALAKLAFCYANLGDDEGANATLERLRKLGGAGKVRIGGGSVELGALVATALKRSPGFIVPARADAWSMPGGSLSNARPMRDVRFNLSKRWEHKIGDDSPRAGNRIVSGQAVWGGAISIKGSSSYRSGRQAASSASPLPVTDADGVVYVNTGRGLFAFDHMTGRVRWSAKPLSVPKVDARRMQAWMYQNRYARALWPGWQGSVSVSVGGGKVFAPEYAANGSAALRSLSAFNAATGSRLWSFRQGVGEGAFESEAYFPWAPKFADFADGPVVVGLARQREQAFLCCLDANTGQVRWKVYIGADPTRALTMYRRTGMQPWSGQPVIVDDGVVYAATGMGVVAAADIATGRIRWISRYPRTGIRTVGGDARRGRITTYQRVGGWKGGFPVLAAGRLYVAPSDANELLVFDRRTGSIVRQAPRGNFGHFAGVRNGDAIFVGGETAAVDLQTGVFHWLVPTPFALEGMPVLTETALLMPVKGALCEITLDSPFMRRVHPIAGSNTKLPLGNIVSCEGRLIASNRAYVTGYFSFEETYAVLSERIRKDPRSTKALLDRGDLCFLHEKYADALRDLQAAEKVILAGPAADPKPAARMKRLMFEARLKRSVQDAPNAVMHVDAARAYIVGEVAGVRFHLARAAALATARRFEDAIDEYVTIVETMGDVKLPDDDMGMLARTAAHSRMGGLVREHGAGIYARVDARIRPQYDQAVADKDAAALQELQLTHPNSSLADNCLFEVAKIVAKEKYGVGRAQNYLLSLTRMYPHSELLGEALGTLLVNCEQSGRFHLAGVLLRDVHQKHAEVSIPWRGESVPGAELYARLMKDERFQRAVRGRGLPVLVPPLTALWQGGTGLEALVTVISEESCFDHGVGLAVDVAQGPPPRQYYGRINRLRAFDTATGRTLWTAKMNVAWSMGDIERTPSPWGRSRFRALVVCSGGVAALCHPDGVIAFDVATGRELWQTQWKRPPTRNPVQWIDANALRGMNSRLRRLINQRPVFAADAGRVFCYLPDTRLMCFDAATGRVLWQAKQKGFGRGGIGLFGDIVAVGGLQPNTVTAYNALTGKALYTKPQPGAIPSNPVYDRMQRRIFAGDSSRVLCYKADDFAQVWASKPETGSYLQSQPWYLSVLSDKQLAVFRYNRRGNASSYEVATFDGGTGARLWTAFAGKYERKGRDYVRVNVAQAPVFGNRFVFIPTQVRERKYVNKRYENKRGIGLIVVDRKTGKTLREFQHLGSNVYPIGVVATAEHAIAVVRVYDSAKRRYTVKLWIVSGETGKPVFSTDLAGIPTSGAAWSMMLQRLFPVATVDGKVLFPTGKGLTCLGTGGPAPKQKEEKADEKKQ